MHTPSRHSPVMERRPGGHHNASENRRDAKMQSKKEPAMMRCWAESDVSKVRRSRKMAKLSVNKITSFPHTLSLCSKKAESKVKRVKSYYCTRVCPKHAKCSNIHVWGAKVVHPARYPMRIWHRGSPQLSLLTSNTASNFKAHTLQQLEACTLGAMHMCTLRLWFTLGVKSPMENSELERLGILERKAS